MTDSVYKVVTLIGTSTESWEKAAKAAVDAASHSLRELRIAEVIKQENASLTGWDDHEIFSQRIRNYTGKEINLEVRRTLPGHISFKSLLEPKLHDYQTVEFRSTVAAGKKMDLLFEVIRLQGTSAKQNNVTLQEGKVAP